MSTTKKVNMHTLNGNNAAAHVAYALSDAAAIFPITPSSDMAENCDAWAAEGKKNIFGNVPKIIEMQSEGGAAGTLHGLLQGGVLASTFTASQGLLLMIPNMYKMVGELLPGVLHVSARTLASHALSIFGDHSDIYSVRSTGFAMTASGTVQEVMDMALVTHLASIETSYPFLHFFDGFRTSHEYNKIDVIDYADIKKLVNEKKIAEFRNRALNPEHPHQSGTAQNPDTFFQNREACNIIVASLPAAVQAAMNKVAAITGRKYNLFDYVGAKDATNITIAMGSSCAVIEETIKKLNKAGGKYGLIKVRLFRPFNVEALVKAIPATVEVITVLDRTKENGAIGDPLYVDVCAALFEQSKTVKVLGGRYGLSSKEFTPDMVASIYENADRALIKDVHSCAGCSKGCSSKGFINHFAVGINDDVTHTSLTVTHREELVDGGGYKFYGLGSDGTVGANRNSVAIIGDNTDLYAQAYFVYDSKKSGGITTSHLRFEKDPITSAYLVNSPSFVACHNQTFLTRFDMLEGIKKGGTFLLNTTHSKEELENFLPASVKRTLAERNISLYIINAYKIAAEIGLGKRINTIMQSAFFKLTNIMPYDKVKKMMKDAIDKSYGKKGTTVLEMNYKAVDSADAHLEKITVPASWASVADKKAKAKSSGNKYYDNFCATISGLRGNELPVSAFSPDGRVPTATSQYEKRCIATNVPKWIPENCIQCNQCALVCPHGCIRPHLIDNNNKALVEKMPATFKTLKATGFENMQYKIQLSQEDCTGCGVCANVCPSKNKALEMTDYEKIDEIANYNYSLAIPYPNIAPTNVKNSQFLKPYFEFSGACAGCGETSYIKLATQLFGKRMVIANATGCTSIYGGSSPTCPYTTDEKGHGPAWANSLFEDNAEFGFGIKHAYGIRRSEVKRLVEELKAANVSASTTKACTDYLSTYENVNENEKAVEALVANLEEIKKTSTIAAKILDRKTALTEKSIWIIGGDGWAYDIDFGGLDHVVANNENVNLLVLDTEVYSNTGGQSSKSTPSGAIAKFAAGGKPTNKKDLGAILMNYDNVYVAQVALGANPAQTLKAFQEAEAHKGPSIIIAYATCINHGIDMSNSMKVMKNAVDCGYWTLYRRDPKVGLVLDSASPKGNYIEHLQNETRYKALEKVNPKAAKDLFEQGAAQASRRHEKYVKLSSK